MASERGLIGSILAAIDRTKPLAGENVAITQEQHGRRVHSEGFDAEEELPVVSHKVKVSDNDTTPDYLHNQLADHDTYDSDDDVLVKTQTLNDGDDESERLFVRKEDMQDNMKDWDALVAYPVKILGKDASGNVGWATLEDFECPE